MEQIDGCYQATATDRASYICLVVADEASNSSWLYDEIMVVYKKQLGARKWVRIQLSSSVPVTGRLTVGDETILGVEPRPLFLLPLALCERAGTRDKDGL